MHSRETDRVIVEQQSRFVDVSGAYCDSKELLTLVQKNNMHIKKKATSFVLNKDSQLKRVERKQKKLEDVVHFNVPTFVILCSFLASIAVCPFVFGLTPVKKIPSEFYCSKNYLRNLHFGS